MGQNAMEIRYCRTSELTRYGGTARVHSRTQRRKLNALVRKFGPVVPIVIDETKTVIDGHLLLEVMIDQGHDEVPTITARSTDPAEIRALRLALNRLPENAAWDKTKLKAEFRALIDLSFDLEFTAFDVPEIDAVLKLEIPSIGIEEDASALVAPTGPAVAGLGDVICCGMHRVICGDARDSLALARLMDGAMAQMLFADPPFNVRIDGHVSGLGRHRHREFAFASGEMTSDQFTGFLADAIISALPHLIDGSLLYVFMDGSHLFELLSAVRRVGLTFMVICCWAKSNGGMGSLYRHQVEFVVVAKNGNAPHINNVELGRHGRHRTTLWTCRGMNAFGSDRDELLGTHPTVKPVQLVADAILDASRRGDIVLDSFLGSGTTMIAAEETGRRCYAVEIDPLYVDAAVRRWQGLTGRDGIFCGTDETFDERAEKVATAGAGTEAPEHDPTSNDGCDHD